MTNRGRYFLWIVNAHRKGSMAHPLRIIHLLVFSIGSFSLVNAQPEHQQDTIADYEIPYIVGESRALTLRLIDDLNSLHANIPEDAKATVFQYIYDAFEEGENGRLVTDLNYERPVVDQMTAHPISISKYALDYELDAEIFNTLVGSDSFRFTFPENTGSGQYEMYGSYDQHFVNSLGDTLTAEPLVKLAGFEAVRDPKTKRFKIKMKSIVFLDVTRQPDFMLADELAGMTQKYFEWKQNGSSVSNLQMMSDEALKETLTRAREKRESKELMIAEILESYESANQRKDVIRAAESFLKAEKLQRNHPVLLSDKTDLSQRLKDKIEQNYQRSQDAFAAWNDSEALALASDNERAMGLWSQMNGRRYDRWQVIKNLETQIGISLTNWEENQLKINTKALRKDFRSKLLETVGTQECETGSGNEGLALNFYLLAEIAQADGEKPMAYFQKSLVCKQDFYAPKLDLLNSATGDQSRKYLDDLIHYEPMNPDYYLMRGMRSLNDNNGLDAEKDFAKALEFDPNNAVALLKLSELELRELSYTAALDYLDNLLSVDSLPQAAIYGAYAILESDIKSKPEALVYVNTYMNAGLNSASRNLLDSIMTLYQKETVRHRRITMQDYEAAKYYEKMYVLAKDIPDYYSEWGLAAQCYYEMGNENNNFERALFFANTALTQSNGRSENGLKINGLVNRAIENYPEAKESFYKLLALRNDYESNFELGETFYLEGREPVTARTYYQDALAAMGNKRDKAKEFAAVTRIGECYRIEKKYGLSEDQFKKAIKIYSKNGEGYYGMALTFLANPNEKKIKKSFKYLEEAEKKGFDGYKVMKSTAVGEYRLKEFKKAKKTFERLNAQYQGLITIDDLLVEAEVFLALNDFKEAAENLKTIVSRNNAFKNTPAYLHLQGLISLKKSRSTGLSQETAASESERAKSNFEDAIKADISHANSYLGLSLAEYFSGQESSAFSHLDNALRYGADLGPYEDDPKFIKYFKSKAVKKKIKAYEK